jgi:hypothetical protein
MNLQDINLNFNPFEGLTPTPDGNLFWAGMGEQKESIANSYREAFSFDPRKVVLNWGPYGGGKTHAAYFFEKYPPNDIDKDLFFHVYVRTPQEGKGANISIIKNIFDSLTIRKVKRELSRVLKELGEDRLFQIIYDRTKSEAFADAIIFFSRDINPVKLLQRFIFDGLSGNELKNLNLPRSLKSDDDYITFLAGIIVAITSGTNKKRFVLWIDEMENMVYYSSQQFKILSQMLRDLVDRVNERMLVFLNFTLAENEEDTVRLLMGDALWGRVNNKIRFSNLSRDEALVYCEDAIKEAQIDNTRGLGPFTPEAIELVVKTIPEINLTPREINRKFNELITFSLAENVKSIDKEVVSEWVYKNTAI